jgi:acyl-CoA hydrolase
MIPLTREDLGPWLAKRLAGTGGRVFVGGCAGEPVALAEALSGTPEACAGLTFLGAWIPGANRTDWAALGKGAEGTFVSADWRASFEARRFAFRPLAYTQTLTWLKTTPMDAALVQVSPPDANGLCSLGVSVDFQPAVLSRRVLKIAQINPAMPAPVLGSSFPLAGFDAVVEADAPLLGYDAGGLDEAFEAIKDHIAGLTPDGASLQFGLGKAGVAALAGMRGRKGLNIWSGMVTDPLIPLLDEDSVVSVTCGVALGSPALYARAAGDQRVRFAAVSETHDIARLAAVPRLVAVNSALEVDLFGQANAERLGGRQVSGVGGLNDFLRGARQSPGGVPIVALNATAKGGTLSRIVPQLASGTISVSRTDMGVVVTEYGVADLRDLDLDGRAQALIAVAASQHRDGLADAWDGMRRGM